MKKLITIVALGAAIITAPAIAAIPAAAAPQVASEHCVSGGDTSWSSAFPVRC